MALAVGLAVGLGFGGFVSLPQVLTFTPASVSDETIDCTATYSPDTTDLCVTETSTPPALDAAGWFTAAASFTYTTASSGNLTLYLWAKGPGGVSTAVSASAFTFGAGLVSAWSVGGPLGGQVVLSEATAGSLATDWTYRGLAITEGQSDPDGGSSARKELESAGANHDCYNVLAGRNLVAGPAIFGCWCKDIGGRYMRFGAASYHLGSLKMSDGTATPAAGVTAMIDAGPDGWFRARWYTPSISLSSTDLLTSSDGVLDSYDADPTKGRYLYQPVLVQHRAGTLYALPYGSDPTDLTQDTSGSQPFARIDATSPGWVAGQSPDLWQPNAGAAKPIASADADLLAHFGGTNPYTLQLVTYPLTLGVAETIWTSATGTSLGRNASNQWVYQRAGGTAVAGGTVTSAEHSLTLIDNGTTCTLYDNGTAAWTTQSHGGGSVTPTSFTLSVSQSALKEPPICWSRALGASEAVAQNSAAAARCV